MKNNSMKNYSKSVIYFNPFDGTFSDRQYKIENEKLDIPPCDNYIQGFIFVLTTRCNLDCSYCYSIKNPPSSMRDGDPISILNHYLRKETEILFINFFGGEPTLEFKTLVKTVEFIKKEIKSKSIYFRITTNGTLSSKQLDYLIENKFSIVISSDGLPDSESLHVKQRIAKNVEKNLSHLVAANAIFRVRCTITSENLKSIQSSLQYWNSLGIKHVHLEPYNPTGKSKEELNLLPDKEIFVEEFKRIIDKAQKLGVWLQTGIFMNLLTPSTYFCTGASGKFRVFNPDGSVTSCYRIQNFNSTEKIFFTDNWKVAVGSEAKVINPYHSNFEKLRTHSIKNFTNCHECEAKYICGGGCLIRNLNFGGKINNPDPWICYVRKELYRYGILKAWEVILKGEKPIIFGRFVFENEVIKNANISERVNTDHICSDFKRPNPADVNIYDVLGIHLDRINGFFQKISRAECI